ncbi:MAG: protein kinase [Pyrinomonadaceae bacterium]
MSPERFAQIDRILRSALEVTPEERSALLDAACADDGELRGEVESLLDAHKQAGNFIERPAVEVDAQLIVGNDSRSLIGHTVSHYRIVELLGAGGMGEVYLAIDTRVGRRVALKAMPAVFTANDERVRRFQQEARAVSALNHPNILTIHEIGHTDAMHFIVTELIEGATLRERLTKTRLKLHEALDISIQIASALAAAHEAGIVHRDIKPENVMIRPDGYVKVLDFGLVKLTETRADGEAVDTEAATQALVKTNAGMVMGTVAYMSPEQAGGGSVDARSDLWSLGVVLYEIITGQRPFEGKTPNHIIVSILEEEPLPLSRQAAGTPEELERIVAKALTKDCEERYQTAKDLLIDLRRLKKRLEVEAEIDRTASTNKNVATQTEIINAQPTDATHALSSAEYIASSIKQHKHGFVVAALAMALLAAVGFGYWFFAPRSPNTTNIESIAVLPFVNASGNADVEYLSDGMTETLINSLSQLPKLNVKARSSVFRYKGKDVEPQTVAAELSVQAILTGRVVQRGDDLVLYLSLVDARNGNHLWGEGYNRKLADLVALQSEIARDVLNKLRVKLSGADEQKVAKNYTANAEAYQLYLKGRFYWFKFPAKEYEKSRDYYQQAIDVDPNYALAYAGLAEYYGLGAVWGVFPLDDSWAKAEAAANKALALDDTLPDAYNVLSGVKEFHGDRAGAERYLRRVIELNPNYAEVRAHYTIFLFQAGRSEEAFAQIKKVLDLEPLSVYYNRELALLFNWTREYDRAVEQCRKTLELDPNDAATHELLGYAYEQKGMPKEAVAEWSKALMLTEDKEAAMILERAFAASGFNAAVRALWQKKLERLNEKAKRGEYIPAMNYARAYTRLADKEQAFAWLAKAEQERNLLIFEIKFDAIYDGLRDDPRFQDLLRRMNPN